MLTQNFKGNLSPTLYRDLINPRAWKCGERSRHFATLNDKEYALLTREMKELPKTAEHPSVTALIRRKTQEKMVTT